MDCKICTIIGNKQQFDRVRIYQDDICVGLLSTRPASLAHAIVFPRKHYTIMEQVPDEELMHIFEVCNKISRAMFESLNIQGTNILVQNGLPAGQEEPHFSVNIIARQENDGIKLDWQPKQLQQEEMSTVELQYKKLFDEVGTKVIHPEQNLKTEDKKADITDDGDEENYLVKYFNKIP
ncbi:HIT family protein [Candidatus Woesearchaeota archaeon]|nr:HIT family protein [Candidatus Woesearchaeota archaeon]